MAGWRISTSEWRRVSGQSRIQCLNGKVDLPGVPGDQESCRTWAPVQIRDKRRRWESNPLEPGCGRLPSHLTPASTVAEVGIEPTIDHQALDLAALPVCVLGQSMRSPRSLHFPVHTISDECVGQELNLHSDYAGGLQPLGLANAQPTHLVISLRELDGTGGIRTHTHQGLSLAARPVGVPCLSLVFPNHPAPPMGFEPTVSTLTGWRALRAAPRGRKA
jgi:hypothetical protein